MQILGESTAGGFVFHTRAISNELSKTTGNSETLLFTSNISIPQTFPNVCICNQMYIYIKNEMDLKSTS